jgi:hypothetical protein
MLTLEKCVSKAESLLVILDHNGTGTANVVETSFSGGEAFICATMPNTNTAKRIHLVVSQCQLSVDSVLCFIAMGSDDTASVKRAWPFTWSGTDNEFNVRKTYLRTDFGEKRESMGIDRLEAWQTLWTSDRNSIEMASTAQ